MIASAPVDYNLNRYYDPKTGRYLEADPIGLEGGWNLYGYANQNPMYYIDPLGFYYSPEREHDITRYQTGIGSHPTTINWFNTGGGRRSIFDGPTNGNWGGKCWGGGRYACGPDGSGNAPPADSADECYKTHDDCYDSGRPEAE